FQTVDEGATCQRHPTVVVCHVRMARDPPRRHGQRKADGVTGAPLAAQFQIPSCLRFPVHLPAVYRRPGGIAPGPDTQEQAEGGWLRQAQNDLDLPLPWVARTLDQVDARSVRER